MFCWHKYGNVQSDGYQYCIKCNKAIVAPCVHIYSKIATFKGQTRSSMGNRDFVEYHLQCTKCGTMKKEVF